MTRMASPFPRERRLCKRQLFRVMRRRRVCSSRKPATIPPLVVVPPAGGHEVKERKMCRRHFRIERLACHLLASEAIACLYAAAVSQFFN